MSFGISNASEHVVKEIKMFGGAIANIPSGWQLCNGTNGTPDLRNRFIVCADADVGGIAKSTISGAAAQTGGTTTHTHQVELWNHAHAASDGYDALVNTTSSTFEADANLDGDTIVFEAFWYGTPDILGYTARMPGTAGIYQTSLSSGTVPAFYALVFITRTSDWI